MTSLQRWNCKFYHQNRNSRRGKQEGGKTSKNGGNSRKLYKCKKLFFTNANFSGYIFQISCDAARAVRHKGAMVIDAVG